MINSRLFLDTPYSQSRIVTGYGDKDGYQSDQYLHLDLLGGGTNLISVIKAYAESYTSSPVKSLLDCRDYFIAKALIATLKSVLYTDSTQQALTSHANKAVSDITTKVVYPELLKDQDLTFAGTFGSLAYYFLYVKPDGYPTDYLTKLLRYVWGILGISYTSPLKDRITKLHKLLGKTTKLDQMATSAMKTALSADNSSPLYSALIHARRNFLTESDVSNFSTRLLTGKYSKEVFPIFAAVLPKDQYDQLAVYKSNITSIFRPAGFNLLLNAIVVEGYLKSAVYISELPESVTSMSLDSFLSNETLKREHSNVIASNLASSYDAIDFVQTYNLYEESTESSKALLGLIYNLSTEILPADAPTRLSTLTNTFDINKDTRQIFTNTLLEELSQLPPTGRATLSIQSSSTANKTSLTATNFTDDQTPIIAFVVSSVTTAPKSYSEVPNTKTTFASKTLVTPVDSNEVLASVALTGSGFSEGALITLDELAKARSDSNVSVSNVQVIENTIIPNSLKDEVIALITEQATKYFLYNFLTATSIPRGSEDARYEAQGVKPTVLSTAQIESTFGYRQEGYIDEYAGRMAGLTKQHKEAHANSEVLVLKEWAEALKQITEEIT